MKEGETMNVVVDVDSLRGAIRKRFKSVSTFALASGIQRSTIERILNMRASPSYETIAACQEALMLGDDEIGRIFFCGKVT